MKMTEYGARIERGRILRSMGGGWEVESYDRPGVITPPLKTIDDNKYTVTVEETTYTIHKPGYQAGMDVYFFMFDDGKGLILHEA